MTQRAWALIGMAVFGLGATSGCGGGNSETADSGPRSDAGRFDAGPEPDGGRPDAGPQGTDSGRPMLACDAPIPALALERITATSFSSPVFVTQPPGSTDLYVV